VEKQIRDFVRCAKLSRDAGYDGVEIMGSEGYFINEFLVTHTNRRTDEWGGDYTQRMRLPVEIVERTREAVGKDFIIIYRLSMIDLIPDGNSQGHGVGKSLYEADMLDTARSLVANKDDRAEIPVPTDVVVADEFSADADATTKLVDIVAADELILDIGPETSARFADIIANAGTIIWNGPVGVFEFDQFGSGTKALAEAIAASDAFSVAGGGDTLAAIDKYGVADRISYISTGGGAFLEFVEGKTLPAVAILEERAR
jgi:hypothetical protein